MTTKVSRRSPRFMCLPSTNLLNQWFCRNKSGEKKNLHYPIQSHEQSHKKSLLNHNKSPLNPIWTTIKSPWHPIFVCTEFLSTPRLTQKKNTSCPNVRKTSRSKQFPSCTPSLVVFHHPKNLAGARGSSSQICLLNTIYNHHNSYHHIIKL